MPRPGRVAGALLATVALLAAAGCRTERRAAAPAPDPSQAEAETGPGSIVSADPVGAPPRGTKGWRILYRSETVQGAPTTVSGLLFVPDPLPPGRPLPVLALAHGTTGLADRCAPSRIVAEGGRSEAHGLPPDVLANHVVVATDYEGLGTPGVHPYLVALSSGRSVLDSIRAAQRFTEAGTSRGSPGLVWGHSQGGGAALVAGELAPTYAPDANVVGVAAGAPASELKLLSAAVSSSPFFGFVIMAAAGFAAAYPDLDLDLVLTPAGREAVAEAAEQCAPDTIAAFAGKEAAAYLKVDPGATEPYASLLEENSPGFRSTTVPVLLYHGEADEIVPAVASKLVLDRYCRNGTVASRRTYPGERHASVIARATPDITAFLADRLAGKPAPRDC